MAAVKLAQGSARAAAAVQERHEVAALARERHAVGAARKAEAVRLRAELEEAEKVGGLAMVGLPQYMLTAGQGSGCASFTADADRGVLMRSTCHL